NKEILKYNENFDRRFSSFIKDQRNLVSDIQKTYEELNKDFSKKSKEQNLKNKIVKTRIKIELTEEKISECEELLRLSNKSPFVFLQQYKSKHSRTFNRVQLLIPLFQGHLVSHFNPDESQRLYRLGRQPAASCRNVRMACPPQQANGGVAQRRHNVG